MRAYERFRCLVLVSVVAFGLVTAKIVMAGPLAGLAYAMLVSVLISVIMGTWLSLAPDFKEWDGIKGWRKPHDE